MAAVSALKARLTAMSQEDSVTVTLAAVSIETAVVISVIFIVLIVREYNHYDKHAANPVIDNNMLWLSSYTS